MLAPRHALGVVPARRSVCCRRGVRQRTVWQFPYCPYCNARNAGSKRRRWRPCATGVRRGSSVCAPYWCPQRRRLLPAFGEEAVSERRHLLPAFGEEAAMSVHLAYGNERNASARGGCGAQACRGDGTSHERPGLGSQGQGCECPPPFGGCRTTGGGCRVRVRHVSGPHHTTG